VYLKTSNINSFKPSRFTALALKLGTLSIRIGKASIARVHSSHAWIALEKINGRLKEIERERREREREKERHRVAFYYIMFGVVQDNKPPPQTGPCNPKSLMSSDHI
jgi:hypothetical protein